MGVDMKKEIDTVSAIPSKRLFQSIIADYDTNTSICELIDNVIDIWIINGKKNPVSVNIILNQNQQTISVIDNAGGIRSSDMHNIVGPGHTLREPDENTIGFFGVGTKRAVVALAQEIKIKSRYRKEKTYLIELDDDWLKTEEWDLPLFEIDNIPENSTIIELQKLRIKLTDEVIESLKEYLQTTYAKFLGNDNIKILMDSMEITGINYDNWAYPPSAEPRCFKGELISDDGSTIKVEIIGGLSNVSSQAKGEYGVFFYCNDRLISRGRKDFEVGFMKGYAGKPHPVVSLTKVIVSLNGNAQAMPWNSSKSDINPSHPIYKSLRNFIIDVVTTYAKLSRRLGGDWANNVFKFEEGKIEEIEVDSFPEAKKSYLPPLPKTRENYSTKVKRENESLAKSKPWIRGIYEGIIAVDKIFKLKLDQKNRICLILLDSILEIGFKEYLVNESKTYYSDAQIKNIFSKRHLVHNEIKKSKTRISKRTWPKIVFYYDLRCKLIHERATMNFTDAQIAEFTSLVEYVLKKLFNVKLDNE